MIMMIGWNSKNISCCYFFLLGVGTVLVALAVHQSLDRVLVGGLELGVDADGGRRRWVVWIFGWGEEAGYVYG